ncbi:extracellular solute-binding protein [Paenibacillus sp.]|uniref:ABC transporter substrate-binding protein n=1 Tax=Paenibacillus sp. TaxID=58172 RepID=UPI002810EDD0|nr:extracellular solute-binding protein [Paenibacillus sp.]
MTFGRFTWKIGTAIALILTLGAALAACSFGGAPDDPEEESATIKVMYWDERAFYQQFGNLFMMQHPNIELEVVSTQGMYSPDTNPIDAMRKLIEEEQPDVLLINEYFFDPLFQDGMLYELETLVAQDEGWIEGMLPAALDKLRTLGNGKLYGLAPSFSSKAIFYNKAMFESYGIAPPTDGMTWDELIAKAELFPTDGEADERVYGLDAFGGAGVGAFLQLGREQGLQYLDLNAKKVTLDTDAWRRVAETALRLTSSEAMYAPEPFNPQMGQTYEDHLRMDLFLTGRLAMKLSYSYYLQELAEGMNRLEEAAELDWDVVTEPINPDAPNETSSFQFNDIFAIHARSTNVDAAWAFVKFVHSDEFTKATSRFPVVSGLPIRTEYIRNDEGKRLEAFYALSPSSERQTIPGVEKIPSGFDAAFYPLMEKHWTALTKEETTIDEALAFMETEGQAALDAAFANEEEGTE